MTTMQFKVHGLDCMEEVLVLKREVGPVVGGEDRLAFDILSGTMTVVTAGREISTESVLTAVGRAGLRAEIQSGPGGPPRSYTAPLHRVRSLLTALSGVSTAAGFFVHASLAGGFRYALGAEGLAAGHAGPPAARLFYVLAILCGGWFVAPRAWAAAKRLRPDMNLLMTIAVIGATALGEWFEAATVSFLFAVSLTLEAWSVGRARRAVAALLDLAPPSARVKSDDGTEHELPPEKVPVGAVVVVRPGERLPIDGTVVAGRSGVNQAPITGESRPVAKRPGDEVFAGTINGDGSLEVRCTRAAADTTLAQIIRLVRDAQSKRAAAEQWVERFARVYTPAVMLAAALALVVPPLLDVGTWSTWLYRSLVLLVIACPCALVISTPVSIVAGLAAAARQGVLVKGGVHLETFARLKAIAFDKTGTLTEGEPCVMEVVPLTAHTEDEVLAAAAALESRSLHPLARAIVAEASGRALSVQPAEHVQVLQGKGVNGRWNGANHWVGSHRYLEERALETDEVNRRLEDLAAAGASAVVVGTDDHVCGFIAVTDRVRPSAKQVLRELRELGIEHVAMLSGDNRAVAAALGGQLGLDDVRAELLPQDKVAAVEELVTRFGYVAMVGDGVNDAPSMARATLGVAMGAAGSDAAIETADIALMGDDLTKLPWLLRHSRRVLTVIRQNIAFSLLVKAAFVVLTFAGVASLWSAIAADMGASLLVIFNGLRLLRSQRTASPR